VFDPESNQKRIVKIPKNNFYETEAEISTRIAHFDHSLKFFVLLNDKKVLNFKGSHKQALIFESGLCSMEKLLEVRKAYSESEIAFILVEQILPALEIFRQNCLTHFDLKPANFILFSKDDHFFYKLSDYGSIMELETKDPLKIDKTKINSLTEFYTENDLVEQWNKNKTEGFMNPFSHDLYSLAISILEMMGLNKQDIDHFKQNHKKESIPEEQNKKYGLIIQFIIEMMIGEETFRKLIEILKEKIPFREEPKEKFYVEEMEKLKIIGYFSTDMKDSKYIDLYNHLFSYLALNSLETGIIDIETYANILNEYLSQRLNKIDKEIKDLNNKFAAYDIKNDFGEAEKTLNLLEDLIIQNSDLNHFSIIYLSSLQMYFYDRINKIDKIQAVFKKLYWNLSKNKICLSMFGNLSCNEKLRSILDTYIFLFNPSHKWGEHPFPNITSFSSIDPFQINKINELTKAFSDCLTASSKDFGEEMQHEAFSVFNVTLGSKIWQKLPKIVESL